MQRMTKAVLMGACSTIAFGVTFNASAIAQERRGVETIVVEAQRREESIQDVPISIGAYSEEQLDVAGVRDIRDLIQIAPGLMVTSTQNETITTARIRGIGTVGDNFGLESSVAVLVDGVYRPRNGVGFGDLGDIERIEVLRGPQGTLFGRNTSAGVINIVTEAPDLEEFTGFFEASLGNYEHQRYAGSLSFPIIPGEAGLSLFGAYGNRDGFNDLVIIEPGTSTVRTTDSDDQNFFTIRGQLAIAPNNSFEGRFIADYTEREEFCCSAPAWDYDPTVAGLLNSPGLYGTGALVRQISPADPEERVAYSNHEFPQNVRDSGFSFEFDWDVPIGTLTSITGYRSWSTNRGGEVDYSALDIAFRDPDRNGVDFDTFSQEIRLSGVTGNVDWLVGAYYANEDIIVRDAINFGEDWEEYLGVLLSLGAGLAPSPTFISDTYNAPPPFGFGLATVPGTLLPGSSGPINDRYNQDTESFALFTHNTISFTEQLDVTLGLRYTSETKEIDASFSTFAPGCAVLEGVFGFDPIAGAAGTGLAGAAPLICLPYARSGLDSTGYDQSLDDDAISGTARLSYRFTDDILGFVGYSRGFKAAGFNLDRQFNGTVTATGVEGVDTRFESETTDAYEIGVNSELFNNVLRLNATGFYQQVEDFQLNTFNGLAFVVESVPQINITGAEVDFLYAPPIDGLDIAGGFAYVDAEYDDFTVAGNPALQSLAGQQISLSPEWFVNGSVTYRRPMFNDVMGLVHIDGRWVSDYNTGSDLDPEKVQDSFGIINARLGLGAEDGSWNIELWGRNLTDETYAQVAFDAFAQGARGGAGTSLDPRGNASYNAFLGAPRTWGVTLSTRY